MDTKTVALVDARLTDDGAGSFTGYASLFGVKDSQGDVVVKGAYLDTLTQFVERGFIAWGHNWDEPVATIRVAREDEKGLFVEADFHSDDASQRARTRTKERLDRGKFMGLSIGYLPLDAEPTKDARLLKKIELFETSLVTVPALAPAGVTGVKGYGLPFDEHAEKVRVALDELLERIRSGSEIRAQEKVGRPISEARRARLSVVQGWLGDAHGEIGAVLEETAPQPKEPKRAPSGSAASADLLSMLDGFRRLQARHHLAPMGES